MKNAAVCLKKKVLFGTAGTVVYRNRKMRHAEADYRQRERKIARAAIRWAKGLELYQLEPYPWDEPIRMERRAAYEAL